MSKQKRRSYSESYAQKHTQPINFQEYKKFSKKIEIIPRNIRQEDYIANLLNPNLSIVFATGPAGTGKTLIAVLTAIKALKEGEITKIVITRPAVGVEGEKHGFLPGTLEEKAMPWLMPIFDVLHKYYTKLETDTMIKTGVIEISPIAYMRGRSFEDTFIIADEMQNSTINVMKMLLTRVGEGSRLVVTGDLLQKDKQYASDNGLADFIDRLKVANSERIAHTHFARSDVQRHPVVTEVLNLYGDE